MKYVKTLVAIILGLATLLMVTGTASATSLTSAPPYKGTIHAESEGVTILHGVGTAECESKFEGTIEYGGGVGVVAGGKLENVTFEKCNSGNDVKVVKPGQLEIVTQETNNNGNGTVTWSGPEIEVTFTNVGSFTCIYSGADIGTLTGSSNTGGTATLDIKAVLPRTGGSIFCGSTIDWTGSYKITTPDYLDVD